MAENSENTEKKAKFSFNCKKCGNCCEERGPIPLVLDDLIRWSKNNVVSTILPYIKFIKTEFGTIDLILDKKEENPYGFAMGDTNRETSSENQSLTCSFYNKESKSCVIYKNRPLSCRTYPLEYDGSQFMVVDAETCPGIGNGTNTKEQRDKLRNTAKKMYKKLSQMRISMPVLSQAMQPFILKELMQMQQEAMKEMEKMTPEQREAFEEQMKMPMDKS